MEPLRSRPLHGGKHGTLRGAIGTPLVILGEFLTLKIRGTLVHGQKSEDGPGAEARDSYRAAKPFGGHYAMIRPSSQS